MSNQVSYNQTTRYQFPCEGEAFTLLQLRNKLAEWSTEVDYSDDPDYPDRYTHYGWNLADQPKPWDGEIPEVGEKFDLYMNKFFDPCPHVAEVVRVNHNLFKVVKFWN